jgi:hypothetical protein
MELLITKNGSYVTQSRTMKAEREDAFGVGMPFPHVIPHSDGRKEATRFLRASVTETT